MKATAVLPWAGAAGIVALGIAWLVTGARVAELESKLAKLDASAAARDASFSDRLAGADEALASGERRDEEISERVARVEEGAGRATRVEERAGTLETELVNAVRVLQQADDDNVLLIQSYGQAIETLERQVDAMNRAWEELPLGTVLAWIPPAGEELPRGWAVCDGTRGTPDLRGLFLRGVGDARAAGRYGEASTMTAAGIHAHDDSSANHTRFGLDWSPSREIGDARVLFDTDILSGDPEARASHGEHVHLDPNVPEHANVLYIVKLEYAG